MSVPRRVAGLAALALLIGDAPAARAPRCRPDAAPARTLPWPPAVPRSGAARAGRAAVPVEEFRQPESRPPARGGPRGQSVRVHHRAGRDRAARSRPRTADRPAGPTAWRYAVKSVDDAPAPRPPSSAATPVPAGVAAGAAAATRPRSRRRGRTAQPSPDAAPGDCARRRAGARPARRGRRAARVPVPGADARDVVGLRARSDGAAVPGRDRHADYFKRLLDGFGGNPNGTLTEFYFENSFGQFLVQVDVYGPYTSQRSRQDRCYYGGIEPGDDGGTDLDLLDDLLGIGGGGGIGMAGEAVPQADVDVDFSQYDNDGDGVVDFIGIVHSGADMAVTGDPCNTWSHAIQVTLGRSTRARRPAEDGPAAGCRPTTACSSTGVFTMPEFDELGARADRSASRRTRWRTRSASPTTTTPRTPRSGDR